jgi:hypothetical protein
MNSSTSRRSPARLLAALAVLLGASAPAAAAPPLLPPDAMVNGRSQQDWSRLWWEWAGSFEQHDSPVADTTGALCGSRQSGDVWFLAGTYGTQRTIRTCRVPAGKHLFFPLINYVVAPRSGRGSNCASVTATAARITNPVAALVLEVDGVRHDGLDKHRFATGDCFDLGARTPEKIRVFPAAANGYYVMLAPLPPGRHTLNFGGVLPSMMQAVTYTLVVEQ